MAERNVQQAQQPRDELRRVVGLSVADEVQKLDGLKKTGAISDAEFTKTTCPARPVTTGALTRLECRATDANRARSLLDSARTEQDVRFTPQKRTLLGASGMSASYRKRTSRARN